MLLLLLLKRDDVEVVFFRPQFTLALHALSDLVDMLLLLREKSLPTLLLLRVTRDREDDGRRLVLLLLLLLLLLHALRPMRHVAMALSSSGALLVAPSLS